MATSRLEDMTIGELSAQVKATNGEEDALIERQRRKIVEATTAKILPLVRTAIPTPPHPWSPSGQQHGCVRCYYPEDHFVHGSA